VPARAPVTRLLPSPAPTGPAAPAEPSGDPLEYISATRLDTWLQCRLKFYFRYVARLEEPPTPASHIGRTTRATLRLWNLPRWRGDTIGPRDLWPRFCQDWDEDQLYEDIGWGGGEPGEKARTWHLLLRYFEETPIPPGERPEGVAARVEVDLAPRGLPPLAGTIDLVREGGRIVIFETPTPRPQPGQAGHANETRPGCDALLYRGAAGCTESGFELHQLVGGDVPEIVITAIGPMSQRQEERLWRILESYVAGVADNDFVPSPGSHCSSCQFSGECRRWH
jgi:hypothetical protein